MGPLLLVALVALVTALLGAPLGSTFITKINNMYLARYRINPDYPSRLL